MQLIIISFFVDMTITIPGTQPAQVFNQLKTNLYWRLMMDPLSRISNLTYQ